MVLKTKRARLVDRALFGLLLLGQQQYNCRRRRHQCMTFEHGDEQRL